MANKSILKYNMITVHPDRVNIVHVTEVKGSSKHQVLPFSDESSDGIVRDKKQIKFTIEDKLSAVTQRKLKRAVKYMNVITKQKKVMSVNGKPICLYKMSFVTLTLSSVQIHSDQLIKSQLINQFLIEARRKWNVEHHIWRLEKQHNGNAHFHFIFDKFIPHAELREVWNRIQNKLGYVDRYSQKMYSMSYNDYRLLFTNNLKYSPDLILKAWKKGKETNWKYPNSTDVHSLMFINNIDAYLIKYLSKDEQNKGITGRLWGCSQNLSNIQGGREIEDSELTAELNLLINDKRVRKLTDMYYTIIFIDFAKLASLGCFSLYSLLTHFLKEKFNVDVGS